jgi:hypothetical protein
VRACWQMLAGRRAGPSPAPADPARGAEQREG